MEQQLQRFYSVLYFAYPMSTFLEKPFWHLAVPLMSHIFTNVIIQKKTATFVAVCYIPMNFTKNVLLARPIRDFSKTRSKETLNAQWNCELQIYTYSRTISSPAGTISRFGTSNCSARFWSKRAPGSIWYGMLCRAFTSFAQAIASSIPML